MHKIANISQFESLQTANARTVYVDNGFWDVVKSPVKLPLTLLKGLGSVFSSPLKFADPNYYRSRKLNGTKGFISAITTADNTAAVEVATIHRIVTEEPENIVKNLEKIKGGCDKGIKALKEIKSLIKQYRYIQK